jgi:hypothetical protein
MAFLLIELSFSVNLVKTLLLLLNIFLSFKVSFKDKSLIFIASFASIKDFTPSFSCLRPWLKAFLYLL